MGKVVMVDYVHVNRPSIKGSWPKLEFEKWSKTPNFCGAYRIVKEYTLKDEAPQQDSEKKLIADNPAEIRKASEIIC